MALVYGDAAGLIVRLRPALLSRHSSPECVSVQLWAFCLPSGHSHKCCFRFKQRARGEEGGTREGRRIEGFVRGDLAEARGAGGELADLHGLVVVGVVLVVRVDVVVALRSR